MQLAADGVVVRHVSGHTFTAYKILTATYSGNVYTEIAWATVTDAAKTALIALNTDDKDSDGDVDLTILSLLLALLKTTMISLWPLQPMSMTIPQRSPILRR